MDDRLAETTHVEAPKPLRLQKPVGWGGWVLLGILALVYYGLAARTLEHDPARSNADIGTDIGVVAVWTAITVAYFRTRRSKSGVIGFLIGLPIGWLGSFITVVVFGLLRHH